jgi:hypothetical protein
LIGEPYKRRKRKNIIMSLTSAILAHKFLVAIALASVTTTGSIVAVTGGLNPVGTMSFTVNSTVNVTSLAKLNLGTLNPGDTKTFTSAATVDVTTSGNYTLSLMSRGLLHDVFKSFSVTVEGLGSSPITLNFTHPQERVSLQSGTYNLTITGQLTVRSDIDHTVTATDVPFLGLGHPTRGAHAEDNDHEDSDSGE